MDIVVTDLWVSVCATEGYCMTTTEGGFDSGIKIALNKNSLTERAFDVERKLTAAQTP
jgi:hypothetical protein